MNEMFIVTPPDKSCKLSYGQVTTLNTFTIIGCDVINSLRKIYFTVKVLVKICKTV